MMYVCCKKKNVGLLMEWYQCRGESHIFCQIKDSSPQAFNHVVAKFVSVKDINKGIQIAIAFLTTSEKTTARS